MELQLEPLHADRVGGLRSLFHPIRPFGVIILAFGATFVATLSSHDILGGAQLGSHLDVALVWVLLTFSLAAAHTLAFVPVLVRAYRRGLLEYGHLALAHARAFRERWTHRPGSDMLGHPDASSLADLSTGYGVVEAMQFVPLSARQAIRLLTVCVLPVAVLALADVPLVAVVQWLVQRVV